MVLSSERADFFTGRKAFGGGWTHETAGALMARMYGEITCELELDGGHVDLVEQCATGEHGDFLSVLRTFLEMERVDCARRSST